MKREQSQNIQGIIDALKQAGINATAQRIAVGRYVLFEADHPTADEVKSAVDQVFPKISMATVYNTLHTLEDAGILRAVKLPHTGKVVYDNNIDHHYHIIDDETGELTDLDENLVTVNHDLDQEYEINDMEIFFHATKKASD